MESRADPRPGAELSNEPEERTAARADRARRPAGGLVRVQSERIEKAAGPRLFVIAGTPTDVVTRVHELWDAGAGVELGTPQGRTPIDGVDLIRDSVLPLLSDR